MSHGGNKKNFQTFSALEFIAAITQHIPERMSQMVRYLGWYSNRMRGDRLKAEELEKNRDEPESEKSDVIVVSGFKTKKISQLMWQEVDLLICPHCDSLMKLISFIYERKVIRKSLDHLGLYEEDKPNRNRAPPVSQDVVERIIESYDDGWPDYEEPFVDVKTLWLQQRERSCHVNPFPKSHDIVGLILYWQKAMSTLEAGNFSMEQW